MTKGIVALLIGVLLVAIELAIKLTVKQEK